jgi:anti-sigma factor ChrR (cupin superfamily)
MKRSAEGVEVSPRIVLRNIFEGLDVKSHGEFSPLHPGVEIMKLYGPMPGESPPGPAAALIRYQPGARVPLHEHTGYEHLVILEGSQSDAQGHYPRGSCVMNPPDSRHAVASEEGCLVLAIWTSPVEVIDV